MIKQLDGTGVAEPITQLLVCINVNYSFLYGRRKLSCSSVRINYKNGGVFYRSARDGYGLKPTGPNFTPPPENLQQEMLCTAVIWWSTEWYTGYRNIQSLGGNSIVLGDNDTGFKQNGMVIWMFMLITSMLCALSPEASK